jgi:two-component system phosphate regulon sensor histidine kinase PhoR
MFRFEKIRREFTADVSHELKTPLHAISAAAELLKSGVAAEADREKFLDIILAESKRMTRIIGDIIAIIIHGILEIDRTCEFMRGWFGR